MGESDGLTEVIERSLLGGERRYTSADIAEISGVPIERAQQLWVALGFPVAADEDETAYTDADADAVRKFAALSAESESDSRADGELTAARTLGQAMARLTEWQADLIIRELGISGDDKAGDDKAANIDIDPARAGAIIDVLNELQEYTWQRHLAAALLRSVESSGTTRRLLVGFADMVGYTRLSRHLDPDELTELLEAFETATTDIITARGGWVIKNVGDEVMFAVDDARAGAHIALAMHEAIADASRRIPEMPGLRVGLAYGPVLTRFGDLYGTVVNVAARLTGVARPGTVLVDDGAAQALGTDDDFSLRHLRNVRVKGFSRLRSHVLRYRKQ